MATDIRRMSKEELDELNRQGAIWRARNKPAQPVTDTIPEPSKDRSETPTPKLTVGEQIELLWSLWKTDILALLLETNFSIRSASAPDW
jgi:hypothetical protein